MARENNTITLQGSMPTKEANASVEVFPGYLVTLNGSGEIALQAAVLEPRIAVVVEDDMKGKTIVDSYGVDERTSYKVPRRGDLLNAKVAAGAAAIVVGDALASAGDGTVAKHGGNVATQTVIGFADEAVDNSGGAEEVFLAVEFA